MEISDEAEAGSLRSSEETIILFGQLQKRGMKFPIYASRQFFLTPTKLRYSHTFRHGFNAVPLEQITSIKLKPPNGILVHYSESADKARANARKEMSLRAGSEHQAKRWVKALQSAVGAKTSSYAPTTVLSSEATELSEVGSAVDSSTSSTVPPEPPAVCVDNQPVDSTQSVARDGLVGQCYLLSRMLQHDDVRTSAKDHPQSVLAHNNTLPVAVELHPLRHYTFQCPNSSDEFVVLGIRYNPLGHITRLLNQAHPSTSHWVFEKVSPCKYTISLACRRHTPDRGYLAIRDDTIILSRDPECQFILIPQGPSACAIQNLESGQYISADAHGDRVGLATSPHPWVVKEIFPATRCNLYDGTLAITGMNVRAIQSTDSCKKGHTGIIVEIKTGRFVWPVVRWEHSGEAVATSRLSIVPANPPGWCKIQYFWCTIHYFWCTIRYFWCTIRLVQQ